MKTDAPAYKRVVLKLSGEALQEKGSRENISPAVVREIAADVILKATKVDGVYDRDPNTDSNAKRYERITFTEALTKRLQVMDSTAFSLCMDNKIPIVVFDMYKPGTLRDAVLGRKVGTLVCGETEAQ